MENRTLSSESTPNSTSLSQDGLLFQLYLLHLYGNTFLLTVAPGVTNEYVIKRETMLIESEGIIERVRYMMESMELNATAFATEAGITPSVISHMLNGRNRPTIETLNNIIAAYPSWSYEWLLFGKGAPKREEAKGATTSLEGTLFGSYEGGSSASLQPAQPVQRELASEHTSQSQGAPFPFTREEVEQIRQMLHQPDAPEREVHEIRIFYSDGSYEIFVPQSTKK